MLTTTFILSNQSQALREESLELRRSIRVTVAESKLAIARAREVRESTRRLLATVLKSVPT
jgi:hypothetical protein